MYSVFKETCQLSNLRFSPYIFDVSKLNSCVVLVRLFIFLWEGSEKNGFTFRINLIRSETDLVKVGEVLL